MFPGQPRQNRSQYGTLALPHLDHTLTPLNNLIALAEVDTRRDNSTIILCFSTSDRTDFLCLAGASATDGEITSALPILVVLECDVVGLEDGGDVVPKRWGELCCWIRERWGDEGTVRGFGGVVFCPYWACCLIAGVGEVGDVGDNVQNTISYGVDAVYPECWVSRSWCQ